MHAKYKKLLLELEFLYSDLEYHEEVLSEASTEFRTAFSIYCDKNKINIEKRLSETSTKEQKEEDSTLDEDVKEIEKQQKPADIKKLFKLIATKTHPDKFSTASDAEKEKNSKIFLEAKAAAEENDFFRLYRIALKLDLEVVPTKTQVKLLEKEALKVKQSIANIENMVAWVWFEEENEILKEKVLERYKNILLD